MCIIDCLSTIVFILPLHLDYTKVIILILWWRNFQLEYWRTFQLVSTPTSMSRWRKKKKKLLSLQKRRKPRKLLNSSFSFQKRLRPFFYVQQIHLRILSFFNQSSLLYHIDSHCTTIKKHIALLARKPAHHFSCGEIRMKPGNSKPHVARMMKIDYCMVDFHIRACLIPSMASFRGCLKKSDMPTCGTEK